MQREGEVRTLKESKQVRGTYNLLSKERGTYYDAERIKQVKGTYKLSSQQAKLGQRNIASK